MSRVLYFWRFPTSCAAPSMMDEPVLSLIMGLCLLIGCSIEVSSSSWLTDNPVFSLGPGRGCHSCELLDWQVRSILKVFLSGASLALLFSCLPLSENMSKCQVHVQQLVLSGALIIQDHRMCLHLLAVLQSWRGYFEQLSMDVASLGSTRWV